MNTCKTCKHYTPNVLTYNPDEDDEDAKKNHLGKCSRWRGGNGSDGYSWNPGDIASNEVVVETDEGWGARMGPDFGCVLWGAK